MAIAAQPQEDSARVVEALTDLLLTFALHSGMFISSDVLAAMIRTLSPQLLRAARVGKSVALLRIWQRRLEEIHPQLMNRAREEATRIGAAQPIFNEQVAAALLIECPPPPDF